MLEALYTRSGDVGKQTVPAYCNNNVRHAPDCLLDQGRWATLGYHSIVFSCLTYGYRAFLLALENTRSLYVPQLLEKSSLCASLSHEVCVRQNTKLYFYYIASAFLLVFFVSSLLTFTFNLWTMEANNPNKQMKNKQPGAYNIFDKRWLFSFILSFFFLKVPQRSLGRRGKRL